MSTNPVIACVINPVSRNHELVWQRIQQHCAALGYAPPRRFLTTIEQPGELQTRQALATGANTIIAVGGDGTIRNISKEMHGSDIPLGIVPTGTANIFHLNVVGKQRTLDHAVRTAMLGAPVPVDIGQVRVSFADSRPDWSGPFLVVVGIGHDAIALAQVSPALKQRVGPLAYFAAGARQLVGAPIDLVIEVDGVALPPQPVWSILVGNCGRVSGGITILPGANVQDGLLNLLRITPSSLANWVPIAWRGMRGSSRPLKSLIDGTATDVTIQSEQPVSIQIDGDVWQGVSGVKIGIEPSALMVRSGSESIDVD